MSRRLRELTLGLALLLIVALVRAPMVMSPPSLDPTSWFALDLSKNLRAGIGLRSSLVPIAPGPPSPTLSAPLWPVILAGAQPQLSLARLRGLHVGLWGAVGLLALLRGRNLHAKQQNGVPIINLGHLILLCIGAAPAAAATVSGLDATPLALGCMLLGMPLAEGHTGARLEGLARVLAAGASLPLAPLLAVCAALRLPLAPDRPAARSAGVELAALVSISGLYLVVSLLSAPPAGAPSPWLEGLAALLPVALAHVGLALRAWVSAPRLRAASLMAVGAGLTLSALGGRTAVETAQAHLSAIDAARAAKLFPPHAVEDQVLRLIARAKLDPHTLIAPHGLGLRAAAAAQGRLTVRVIDAQTSWAALTAASEAHPNALILLPNPLPLDWRLAQEASGALGQRFLATADQPEGVTALRARGKAPPQAAPRPVVVIGVDGADWQVMAPMIDRGELPTFAKLRREGASQVDFDTLDTTASPVIWTTVATGQPPEVHGVTAYTQDIPEKGKVPITSDARKVPAVWNLASEAGLSVSVINWWASWPAEAVNGQIISDHANPAAAGWMAGRYWDADTEALAALGRDTYPPSLAAALRDRWIDPQAYPYDTLQAAAALRPDQLALLRATPPNERNTWSWFKTFYALDQPHARIAAEQLEGDAPDLLMVYLRGPDPVQHYAWDTVEPLKYRSPAAHLSRDRGAVEAVYRFSDQLVGAVMQAAGPEATIIVLSDHGAEPSPDAHRSKRRDRPGGHTREAKGVLFIYGPEVLPGHRIEGAGPLDITPTIAWALGLPVADDLPGRVLSDPFNAGFQATHARLRTPSYGPRAPTGAADTSAADANMLDQLRGLGYIE